MTNTAEKRCRSISLKSVSRKAKLIFRSTEMSTYTMTIGSRNSTGTYTVQDNEITLKRKGLLSRPVTANLALKGNEMQITFKADKLLDFLTNITTMTGNSTLNMIGNIASGYDGMQLSSIQEEVIRFSYRKTGRDFK